MFSKYIYDLKDYMLSGTHKNYNMVWVKDTDIKFEKTNNPKFDYANAILTIAKNSKIIIEPNTKIIGSTYYLDAACHEVPFLNYSSVSHTTIDFRIVVEKGINYLKNQIISQLIANPTIRCKEPIENVPDKKNFWEAQLMCIEAFEIWHKRYLEKLKELGKEDIIEYFENVPFNPAKNFKEAVQSLFFTFAFVRLCGNWPGIGRIDEFLYPYYEKDLSEGKITYKEARELLANMWVKGCEWAYGYDNTKFTQGTGDAQHYQNIILGGTNINGEDITNDVTYMVLDIAEELSISDFPISVRLHKNTPEKLYRRVAEVIRKGGGIVATYNETINIKALERFGYSYEEAVNYANDGCWEAIIPGKTNFIYTPFDLLLNMQETLFNDKDYSNFEDFYSDFEISVEKAIKSHKDRVANWTGEINPAILVSLFVEGCIEKGLDYHEKGPKYTVHAIHAGGIANAADALGALKELVFDKKEFTYKEYVDIVKSNWENRTDLRIKALKVKKYGNDDEGDLMAVRVYDSFTKINEKIKELNGVLFPSGISTFGRELEWSKHRKATTDGHLAGEVLAGNMSPSPNCDISGPTSMLKSYCKLDFTKLPNIGPLDMKIHPSALKGDDGVEAIMSINKAFVDLGGCFLQINVVDRETLLDAQAHPERHENLSVRVSGWNARFATLDKKWQDMVINRTEKQF